MRLLFPKEQTLTLEHCYCCLFFATSTKSFLEWPDKKF
jgi:hypothetical protein